MDEQPRQPRRAAARADKTRAGKAGGGKSGADKSDADAGTVAGVTLSHPDRVLYADQGLTKRGLAEYYELVADLILPHLIGRPISLVRCPAGQSGQCFYQKHVGAGMPGAIRQVPIVEADGDTAQYVAIDNLKGLISLVQLGVLELHPWGARSDDPRRPDRLIFDLDPGTGVEFTAVKEAAVEVRDRLTALKLRSFLKVTGGKGLHVVVPITRKEGWPAVKAFARGLAAAMQHDAPDRYEIVMSKQARRGKIFVDYLRNEYGATAIAPYSTRARPDAPVAAPIDWGELPDLAASNQFTVATLPRRLARGFTDPWAEFGRLRQSITRKAFAAFGVDL